MQEPTTLDAQIDLKRREIRADKFDITYGEFASMYENDELVISPDYQRLFRWRVGQKTRFVESILLGIPTPAIFVAERDDGVWELVDGLQRLSTIFEFIGILKDTAGELRDPLRLSFDTERNYLGLLEGKRFEDLSLRSRLSLKRAGCRAEIVKVGSSPRMKYDLFERVNTGGLNLSPQEIRNCIFRAEAPDLMTFIDELAEFEPFKNTTPLSENQSNAKYDRGLVVRFLALRGDRNGFRHDVEPFLTDFMYDITEHRREFDRIAEGSIFRRTFEVIDWAMGTDAFRYVRDGEHRGAFSPSLFEAIGLAVAAEIQLCEGLGSEALRQRIMRLKADGEFREATGPGSNTRAKFEQRLRIAQEVITAA